MGGGGSGGCPPVNRITDTCKNITLATTSLRPVIMSNHIIKMLRFQLKEMVTSDFSQIWIGKVFVLR